MDAQVCLVTGAAGFIGSRLAETLLEQGHAVVGIDSFADFYPRWMKERNLPRLRGHERFRFVEGDLLALDLDAVLHEGFGHAARKSSNDGYPLGPISVIFHLAAQAGVRDSWGRSFEVYLRNNVLATQKLLEAAREAPVAKVVMASSSSIYGDAETFPTGEDVVPRPVSPYGVTKLSVENLAWLYWRTYGVPSVCLRYFTVYGPRQRPDMAFHRFIRAMLEGRELVVYGDGEQTRDFTFVDDAIQATILAGFSNLVGTALNVGGGSRTSVNSVIQALEEILSRPARVRRVSPGEGDVRHTSADTRRAAAIGYTPRTSMLEGLRAEVGWLQALHGDVTCDVPSPA